MYLFNHLQIKTLPFEHNCPTTKLSNCKIASQGWIADRLGDWVKKNPDVGAAKARAKLQNEYNIKFEYNKTWYGMKVALDQIHGSYEDSFSLLFNWKAEIERKSPGSIIEIELLKNGSKYYINRIFVAFKSCIDGHNRRCHGEARWSTPEGHSMWWLLPWWRATAAFCLQSEQEAAADIICIRLATL
jgi:hypothetical protein